MKYIMNLPKKIALGVAVTFLTNFAFAQTLQDGINSIDSHKYAKAKKNFEDMLAKSPSAENYFYLGNTYLSQSEPNFAKAQEYFNKGLAADSKSYLNKIGLATVKLGKGDKSGISEIQNIVKDSREKDDEVLFRAAEALTMYENTNAPDLAISFLNKAVERAQKNGVPAHYYYTLGDAYRLKRLPGDAMTAYDKAAVVAKNKASVYTRMGTLWMAAQQWKLAKEKINQAITTDPTYAPAYKANANYNIVYQQNGDAAKDLLNYSKYADEDPYTQLEIAKLYFTVDEFAQSKTTLDNIFDKVDDPIKYKLRALLQYANGNYVDADTNIDKFMSSAEKSRILPADEGLKGLILAGHASKETDAAKKASMMSLAQQKIMLAKNAKDKTFDWDLELAKIQSGGGASASAANAGPTNPAIEALKKQNAANPQDADVLVKLGTAYQEAQNWNGAILTWDKMIALAPTWAYSYYAKGVAYQQLQNNAMAEASYQKYIDTVLASPPADQQQPQTVQTLSYAYYLVAFFNQENNPAKAKDYAAKAVQLNPTYEDAVNLNNQLNK